MKRIAYLVTDPTIRLDVPSGPATHINGAIKGFLENGLEVRPFIASEYAGNMTAATLDSRPVKPRNGTKHRGRIRVICSDIKRYAQNRRLHPQHERDILDFSPHVIFERSWLFSTAGQRIARKHGFAHFLETSGCAAEITAQTYGISSISAANALERRKLQQADLAVVESRAAVEWVRKKFSLTCDIAAKPLGFDVDDAALMSAPPDDRAVQFAKRFQMVVAFAGTFRSYQGGDLLLRAIKVLSSTCPGVGFMLIGGGGNQRECVDFAVVNNLTNVFFAGLVPSDAVAKYLSLCQLAVVPDCEPHMSPIKTLHYGSCKLPVVVPDYACFDGLIDDGREGRRFEPRSFESLATVIGDVFCKPSTLPEMTQRVYRRISEEYSWKQVVSEVALRAKDLSWVAK